MFSSLSKPKLALIIWAALLIAIVAGVVGYRLLDFSTEADPYADMSDEEKLAAAEAFYASRPYYERPHAYSEVPEGLPDLRAETCGACHGEIYKEWSISTHARAWKDDAQFMEELKKSSGEYDEHHPNDVSWMCTNCHTPMINQLERLVVDLEDGNVGKPVYVDNPFFDPAMQDDAISCATCHVQDGIVYGPRGDTDAPHPVAKSDSLIDERNCVRCHQAEAHFPDQNLACFFTTGAEWEQSPAAEAGQSCQHCHMPQTHRKLAEAFDVPERETRHHWFGGSLIPKHPDFEEEIAPLREIFGSGASIALVEHPDTDGLAVRVYNEFAGHLFPTGDPERHVDVDVIVRDEEGEVLQEVSERIGSIYEWWPEIKLLSDNRIKPGESLFIDLDLSSDAVPTRVEIKAHKMRMYQEAFDYHELEGRYVRGRIFHQSSWTIEEDRSFSLERIKDDWGERDQIEPPTDSSSQQEE